MNRLLEAQRSVNQTMAAHMNATVAAQETQSKALVQLVENTCQREFDKLFNAIPIYDGQDPDRFEPWLEQPAECMPRWKTRHLGGSHVAVLEAPC